MKKKKILLLVLTTIIIFIYNLAITEPLENTNTIDDNLREIKAPNDTVYISNFSDPVDTGGKLNIEFYKEGISDSGYFRLYYAEGYTTWPGNSSATIIDSITSPYDLVTNDEINYMIRIYWLDNSGNPSPNYAEAGPIQSINNDTIYVGSLNTYEFGTEIYPYDTIQEGINNALDNATVNVESKTYADAVNINKPLQIKGLNSNIYTINNDVTLDGNPITITEAEIKAPHAWYITNNALIQDGIDAADSGDSLKVDDGTYTENLLINKSLQIHSLNGLLSTTVTASNTGNHVIIITADSVTFTGFSVYGAEKPLDFKAGIYMNAVDNCNIYDNRLGYLGHQNDYGILIENSNYNFISNNHCNYNNYTGFSQKNSTGNILVGNESTNNVNYGIINMYCDSTELKYNVCNNNVIGIHFFDSHNSFIIGDTTNFNDYYGLNLRKSTNNFVFDNYAKSNDDTGIRLNDNCNYNVIKQNRTELNVYGLKISSSSDYNTITGNELINNTDHGMILDNSDNNILTKNLSDDNTTFGLNIISSNNNNIYLNAFTNNSFAINSNSSVNNWNSPTTLSYEYEEYSYHKHKVGNYYNNYMGNDLNYDGIGDTPYSLPGDEPQDNSPLVLPPDSYLLHAWWLHDDSVMYENYMAKPISSVSIPPNVPYICNSNQQTTTEVNFAATDYYNGQLLFESAPASGDYFTIETGYSTDGDDFTPSGQDTEITGDGSTRIFNFQTDDSRYTIPANSYFALRISNNNTGTSYNLITGGGVSYLSAPVYNPEAGLTPSDSLNFGKIDTTNTTDTTLSFILKNIGNAELIIDSLSGLQQPFSINFSPPETLQVNDSIFVPITLEREYEVGYYADTLHLYDNNNNSSLVVTAHLAKPTISITPENIDFGSMAISSEPDSLPFVIKNIGTSNLIISDLSGLSAPFALNHTTPDTIFPQVNDSSTIYITFDRNSPGIFTDTLFIQNNDVDSHLVVTGELTEPVISIAPQDLDFGTMSASDQTDSLSFKIYNIGTGDLIVDGLDGLDLPFDANHSLPFTILPGDSSEVFVTLDMNTFGTYLDTLIISNNNNDSLLVVSAELTSPEIELSTDYLNFGSSSCALEYDSLSFVIKNIGTENLNIESLSGLDIPFEINYQTPNTIQPQDSTILFVKLDKSTAGSFLDTLMINNNDQDTILVVNAEITAADICIHPTSLDFGVQLISGDYDSLSFTITNTGTDNLTIDNLDGLSLPFSSNFSTPVNISPQDSSIVFVKLDKSSPGIFNDTLNIYNNVGDTFLVVDAELTAPNIYLNPENSMNFGSMGVTSLADSTKNLWILNTGTADLIINNLWGIDAPFSFNCSVPATIIPGDSVAVPITMERDYITGTYMDTLMIDNNDNNTSLVISGELTEPIISLDTDSLHFGSVAEAEQTISLSFFINNVGTGNLVVDGLSGLAAPFTVSHTLPDTITASENSEVFIYLDRANAGTYKDTLIITNNDNDTSLVVTAIITTPVISLDPDALDFGVIEKSTGYDSLSSVIKNLGDGTLIINEFTGLSEPFSFNHIVPDTIDPTLSDSINLKIFVDKSISGSFCDTLNIINNDEDTSLVINAEIQEPIISITPDTLDFGLITISTETDSLPFIIKNLGNADLLVTGFQGLSTPFSLNYITPDTISSTNDSAKIFITLDQNNSGSYCDTLYISSNSSNNDSSLTIMAQVSESPEPIIDYITDVPYDQGRKVVINWFASPLDLPDYQMITGYSIWRKQDWAKEPWEYIGFTQAHYFDEYAFIAPTISDSSAGIIPYYTFIVSAETTDPFVFYNSEPDSGYSVDNIAPNTTDSLSLSFNDENSLQMRWSEVEDGTYNGNTFPELNGVWYKIYGSSQINFECNDDTYITTTQDTTLIYELADQEKMFFKIITTDQPPAQNKR